MYAFSLSSEHPSFRGFRALDNYFPSMRTDNTSVFFKDYEYYSLLNVMLCEENLSWTKSDYFKLNQGGRKHLFN